ncbi:hypothetical protein OH687_28405 [Burkholderia anthina]|nr:hypothetical protein OH687_28405 [Burkholderia anthina]
MRQRPASILIRSHTAASASSAWSFAYFGKIIAEPIGFDEQRCAIAVGRAIVLQRMRRCSRA